MKKLIIVGGGLAGLSTALFSCNDFSIELIDAAPRLGGRIASFEYRKSPLSENIILDNGQHLMMGCYYETTNYIKRLSQEKNLEISANLHIPFVERGGEKYEIKTNLSFYPFGMMFGFLTSNLFSFIQKLRIIYFITYVKFISSDTARKKLKEISVLDWLKKNKQDDLLINRFWKIIVVSTLNCSLEAGSAYLFYRVISEVFLSNKASKNSFSINSIKLANTQILLNKVPLSNIFVEPLYKYSNDEKKITFHTSERVIEIVSKGSKAISIITNKRVINEFEYLVFALPPFALERIKGIERIISSDLSFDYNPIITAYIWLRRNDLTNRYYAFIDSVIDWVFNSKEYIAIVISDAKNLVGRGEEKIKAVLISELNAYLNIEENQIENIKIIIEKRATVVLDINSINKRADQSTKLENVFIAGDWVDTGLPATIEGAILSGVRVSELLS